MRHGGNIDRDEIALDYSVNMNPLGVPEAVKTALHRAVDGCMQYPDFEQEDLKKAIAEYEQRDSLEILCGNGSSELFVAIAHAVRPGKTVIPVPSFYGYEYAANTVETEILYYQMKAEDNFALDQGILSVLTQEVDLLYLANPNNPTGQVLPCAFLKRILQHCKRNNICVVLDECFLPFCRQEEEFQRFFACNSFSNLIRVRAFTKTFSIPGVRLGYLICGNRRLRQEIAGQLPEWNLSVFAQKAGVAAVAEKEHIKKGRRIVEQERVWMEEKLCEMGFQVYKSESVFILFFTKEELAEKMRRQGILIRDCSNFRGLSEGYYRIAVKTRKENQRLLEALQNNEAVQNEAENEIEILMPQEIEKRSFEMISRELQSRGIILPEAEALVTKRVIHTSADFDYAATMCYSEQAVEVAKKLILEGADIVTDTNMALAGINKKVLGAYGGAVHCFMADEDVARIANERNTTRAAVSMEKAAAIHRPVIFAIGNAPTALLELYRMIQETAFRPAFIIGVPVGFVNVVQAKELIQKTDIPYIINRGRKGGSNVAAAICNAILYQMQR